LDRLTMSMRKMSGYPTLHRCVGGALWRHVHIISHADNVHPEV